MIFRAFGVAAILPLLDLHCGGNKDNEQELKLCKDKLDKLEKDAKPGVKPGVKPKPVNKSCNTLTTENTTLTAANKKLTDANKTLTDDKQALSAHDWYSYPSRQQPGHGSVNAVVQAFAAHPPIQFFVPKGTNTTGSATTHATTQASTVESRRSEGTV